MGFKYDKMAFGKKDERIVVLHFRKPMRNGFAGMVSSRQYSHNIALVVDKTSNEVINYDFACLATTPGNTSVRVMLDEDIFYGIKRNDKMARTVLFHELGHYANNHLKNGMADMNAYDHKRYEIAQQGNVIEQEQEADLYAVRYLGLDYVYDGLFALRERLLPLLSDGVHEEDEVKTAVSELDSRLLILKSMENRR